LTKEIPKKFKKINRYSSVWNERAGVTLIFAGEFWVFSQDWVIWVKSPEAQNVLL